jgi:hypothetical protein
MNLQENILRIKEVMGLISEGKIECEKCGWSWDEKDTEPHDKYVCHKCGNDNTNNYE